MGISIALGLSRFAPIDTSTTDSGHGDVLITILVIVALLIVTLLIGVGVTLARRPGKQLDEWGNPTSTAAPTPPASPPPTSTTPPTSPPR